MLTLAPTDNKVTIDPSKAASNHMLALVLPGELAGQAPVVQIQEMNRLRNNCYI